MLCVCAAHGKASDSQTSDVPLPAAANEAPEEA
jgi:hypothetical protein